MAEQSSIKMLRINQVEEKVGYKKSTIFEWMKEGSPRYKSHFPLPRKNGKSNRWFESEIDDFCLLEFGGSNNHPSVGSAHAVNNRREVAGISAAHPGDASKTMGKSRVPSSRSKPETANLPGNHASAEQDAEPPSDEVADLRVVKIARATLDAPQTVDKQPLVATDLFLAALDAKPNLSEDGMSTTLLDETATSSFPVTPVPSENATATHKEIDEPARTRVIQVQVKKFTRISVPFNRNKST